MELEIRDVSKTYANGVHALKDINLTISKGMFGLLGPNGAGKSSIMRTIATLQTPDSGKIYFDGQDIFATPAEFRRQLGYLPQDFGVYANASATDMLDYFARLKGIHNAKERKNRINELLELVNLTEHCHKAVDTYSGGMRQRFGIAQVLLTNPKVIIVDEPTAGLDPAERNRFYSILHQLTDSAIVILSTHIVGDVTNLCDDMGILNQGTLLSRGKPDELVASIKHQIWHKSVSRNELKTLRDNYKVISTRIVKGNIQATIQSETAPTASFIQSTADLEDFYFSYVPELAV
ncbi:MULTISPECIES: ABC transporter ATP-binding protein [Pseudoalteromonas]|uniref:ABC transporter ATP-binding protein n=1 Tax=Pseudoalteromonas TaxID=53246 RepID=UPI000FFEAA44|nr:MULTISPECIES: ABC transporter ATP-binding protein [Pseudoalteromonas]NKC21086.1 ATP-binding cassette domain-containing protein [Pseudoalteromonas galatheae]RXE87744.1 ABC transporter ATP-binding protein [Pseudoalteromonas sp. A757]